MLGLHLNLDLAIRYQAKVSRFASAPNSEAETIHEELEMLCPPGVPNRKKRIEKMLAKILMKIMDKKGQQ